MELHIKPKMTIMILLGVLLTTSEALAQLKLESVYPALGVMDQGTEGAYSPPTHTTLTQESGLDMFEDDDSHLSASVIIVLRALTGLETTGLIRDNYAASRADVNGDGKIGLQDVVYILQKVAGVR